MANAAAVPTVPFEIASQYSVRPSFQIPAAPLAAAALTRTSPVQVPAVGFIRGILLEVTLEGTGGTTPALLPDAPWNVIQNINFRNSGGTNLIAPTSGYQLYLQNKYGGAGLGFGAAGDPRAGLQYTASGSSAHFFLWLNLDIDPSEAYGAIPALNSSQNYQLDISFSSIAEVFSGSPSVTVAVDASVHYFDQPPATNLNGQPQAVEPAGAPATSIWQIEQQTVSPGSQLVNSTNVGGVIRNHILTLRNAAGARIDAAGAWPNQTEVRIDNAPRFNFQKTDWEFLMSRWYGYLASTKNVVNGLDTGVYVIPYHALLASQAGDPANTRAQLMPTLNATLLQFAMQDFGAGVNKLEIMTQSISTTNTAYLYSK